MDLEIVVLSKVSQRHISYDIAYTSNQIYYTNELKDTLEIDSQT